MTIKFYLPNAILSASLSPFSCMVAASRKGCAGLRIKPSYSYRLWPLNRQRRGLCREETRVEKTYIGQRAHSAIQYQKASFNTYYFCPFSQSGHLKPSSFTKPDGWGGGGWGGEGSEKGFVTSNVCVCGGGYCHTNGQIYLRQKHTRAKTASATMRSASKKTTFSFYSPPPERQLNVW